MENSKKDLLKADIKKFELNIREMINDIDFLRLNYSFEKQNIFDVMGGAYREQWHSSFVSWLLSPIGNHGLESFALRKLLSLYYMKQDDNVNAGKILVEDIYDDCLKNMRFSTEYGCSFGKKRGRIDIIGQNEHMAITIENKIKSNEHDEQTVLYYNYIDSKMKNKKNLYIFLTVNKECASDEHFINITYQELFDYVIEPCLHNPQISLDGKYLLENYANNLRNPLPDTEKPMAYTNKKLCSSLYEKYGEVIECIRKVVETSKEEDESLFVREIFKRYRLVINEILESVNKSVIIAQKDKNVPKGNKLIEELVKQGKIVPGEQSAEFTHCAYGKTFEVDVIEEAGKIVLIAGYYDGEEYDGEVSIPCITWNNRSRFTSATEAIDSAIYAYKEKINESTDFVGPGSSVLKNYEGKTLRQLWLE